jgi:futalosine hydrolase
MKKVLVVSATPFEIQPFIEFLKQNNAQKNNPLFGQNGYEIDVLITGVGIANTAYKVGKMLTQNTYHLALNVGVAGSFSRKILRGDVLEVESEQYGDLGVEEADGSFTDMFSMGLMDGTKKPFYQDKLLNNNPLNIQNITKVKGLTVQKVHGTMSSIEAVLKKYPVDIESMEGAAFFQVCITEGISFAEIRAISNYVEPRNKENWMLKEAIENLNHTLINMLEKRLI